MEKCTDPPTEALPMAMQCVECEGTGCDECHETGTLEITQCPLRLLDPSTRQFITHAEMCIEHGLPPVAGGSLDQTVSFMDGAMYIAHEINYWKKELGIFDG